jgi:AraC family transcriptional regulator
MVEEVWRQAMDTVQEEREAFHPVLARTRTIHRPVGPVAYDCVKVIIVRDGSAILFSEFGQKPVTAT